MAAGKFKPFIQLLRPKQYIKNLLIFAPAFFALRLKDPETLANLVISWFAFSLVASSVYVFNDIRDRESDRKHPKKRFRPLASRAISVPSAMACMFICWACGLVIFYSMAWPAFWFVVLYIVINIAYTLKLKSYAVVDVQIIALGFVIRLFIGGRIAETPLSHWIVIVTFLLALFLALAKRRSDVVISEKNGVPIRKSMKGYNLDFLNGTMVVSSTLALVSYIMYTISPEVIERAGTPYLYCTSFFVLMGFLRYMQRVFVEDAGGSPTEALLKDPLLQLTVLMGLGVFAWLIY